MAKRNISVPLKNDNGEVIGLICTQCGEGKPLDCFYNHKNAKVGKSEKCKDCTKAYYKTPEKRKDVHLKSARYRCNNRNYKTYFDKKIECFLTLEDIYYLWDRDNADAMEQPSLDRIDNNKNYTIDNCRFIEHIENSIKDNFKPILQKTLDGKILRYFESAKEAAESVNARIDTVYCVARGSKASSMGFVWEYADKSIDYSQYKNPTNEVLLEIKSLIKRRGGKIEKLDSLGNIVMSYPTITEAAKAEGVYIPTMYNAVNRGTFRGYGWRRIK